MNRSMGAAFMAARHYVEVSKVVDANIFSNAGGVAACVGDPGGIRFALQMFCKHKCLFSLH